MARCCGCTSSVRRSGEAPCEIAIPNPRKKRAAMNMRKLIEMDWSCCRVSEMQLRPKRLHHAYNNTKNHDQAANDNAPATPKVVCNVWYDGKCDERTNGHDAGEKTKKRTFGVVEVVLPRCQTLETIDHRSIISVRGRCDHDTHQAEVCPPERWVLGRHR